MRAGERLSERALEQVDRVGRHAVVDRARDRRDPGLGVAGEVEPRIHGDAVPPDADTGTVDVRERLGVGGIDHPVDVDPGAVGEPGELVGERDVDVAVGRLGELRQFGRLRGAHRADLGAEERAVQLDRALLARLAQTPDELRIGVEVLEDPARVHPLGAVDGVEVLLGTQPRRLGERGRDALPGGPDRQRRLDAHDGPGLQSPADVGEHRIEHAEVRAGVGVDDERRHRDHQLGALGDRRGRIGGRPQPPRRDDFGQRLSESGLAGERLLSPR